MKTTTCIAIAAAGLFASNALGAPLDDLANLLKTDWKSVRITAADDAAIGSAQVREFLLLKRENGKTTVYKGVFDGFKEIDSAGLTLEKAAYDALIEHLTDYYGRACLEDSPKDYLASQLPPDLAKIEQDEFEAGHGPAHPKGQITIIASDGKSETTLKKNFLMSYPDYCKWIASIDAGKEPFAKPALPAPPFSMALTMALKGDWKWFQVYWGDSRGMGAVEMPESVLIRREGDHFLLCKVQDFRNEKRVSAGRILSGDDYKSFLKELLLHYDQAVSEIDLKERLSTLTRDQAKEETDEIDKRAGGHPIEGYPEMDIMVAVSYDGKEPDFENFVGDSFESPVTFSKFQNWIHDANGGEWPPATQPSPSPSP